MTENKRHWNMPDGFMNRLTQQENKASNSRWKILYASPKHEEHDEIHLYISEKVAAFINSVYEKSPLSHEFLTIDDWFKLPKERLTFFRYVATMASEKMQKALNVRPEHCYKAMSPTRIEIQKNYIVRQAKHQHDIDQEYIQRVFKEYLKWHLK